MAIGFAAVSIHISEALDPSSRQWTEVVTNRITKVSGVEPPEAFSETALCSDCSGRHTRTFAASPGTTVVFRFALSSPGSATVVSAQGISLTTIAPLVSLNVIDWTPLVARCDSQSYLPRPGCINPTFIPTTHQSDPRMPGIIANIRAAQAAHPRWGVTAPLTRATPAVKKRNRALACRNVVVPKGSGLSCDEFPFAGTNQGGAGARTAIVPQAENDVQGGIISGFYRRNRVLYGDEFFVTTS